MINKKPPDLIVSLFEQRVVLELRKGTGVVDFADLPYYHNLEGVLISGLDKLLHRNRISPKALKTHKIQGNLGKDSTSWKIVNAYVQALKVNF